MSFLFLHRKGYFTWKEKYLYKKPCPWSGCPGSTVSRSWAGSLLRKSFASSQTRICPRLGSRCLDCICPRRGQEPRIHLDAEHMSLYCARKEYRLEVLEWILQCLALSRSQPPVRSRRLHISLFSLPENRIRWSLELGSIITGLTYYWIVACHEASTDVVPVLLAQVLSDLARKKGQPKKLREVEMVKKLPLVARSTRWQRTQKLIRPSFLEGRKVRKCSSKGKRSYWMSCREEPFLPGVGSKTTGDLASSEGA